jgi:protein SCO1/2
VTQSTPAPARSRLLLPAAAFVVLLAAGIAAWTFLAHGQGGAAGGVGGPFTLVDGNGHAVTDRDFRGRYLLVYFGYTFCPDVCPTTLNEVAGALDALGPKADRLQALFITVDPQRDTPSVVRDYAASFSPRIKGLTGSPEQIAKVAEEYRVYYAPQRSEGAADAYTVDHSSILYLMDPDGHFILPMRTDQTAQALAAELAKHIGA